MVVAGPMLESMYRICIGWGNNCDRVWGEGAIYLHAGTEVPDLQPVLVYSTKDSGPSEGPRDIQHSSVQGGEDQHGGKQVLSPQPDGPVCRAAQEHVRAGGGPGDLVHGPLNVDATFSLVKTCYGAEE